MFLIANKSARTRTRRPKRGLFRLRREIDLPHSNEKVFRFFTDAFQLETITPPWLRFQVITPPPIVMCEGLRIDYRLRLHGLPLRWTSEIAEWEPPHRFVDTQVRGPYRWWCHEHLFIPAGGMTRVVDRVEYAVLGGRLVNALLVRRDVERVFCYREQTLREFFDPSRPAPESQD